MKRGIALDTTGWLILGIIAALVVIGITFLLRGPVEKLLADSLDMLRFG
jgi:hypothetical protein